MIKVIDVDKLFDKYIEQFVYSNIGKLKPEEIENKIPELYDSFGDQKLEELDNLSPNEYYKNAGANELLECLKGHVQSDISVPDFLCEAIVNNEKNEDALVKCLKEDEDEQFMLYLMNMLGEMKSKKAFSRYLELIIDDYSESIRELATELLREGVEVVKEEILQVFPDTLGAKRACLVEVLSYAKWDDRIFKILTDEFIENLDNIPLYVGYLAKYGDDRAIDLIEEVMKNEKIKYADFEELRFALEALGGEFKGKTPDFTKDATYKKIFGQDKVTD